MSLSMTSAECVQNSLRSDPGWCKLTFYLMP